jgi:hypothetical protein
MKTSGRFTFQVGLLLGMSIALGICAHGAGSLRVRGTARGQYPTFTIVGSTNKVATECAFDLLVRGDKINLELDMKRSAGRELIGTIFADERQVFSLHNNVKGEDQFGPTKGQWDEQAYIDYSNVPDGWEGFPPTVLLPFWRDRYPLTAAMRVPDLFERLRGGREGFYKKVELHGNVPKIGSEIQLFCERNRVRERWLFFDSTNVLGVELPLRFHREVYQAPTPQDALVSVPLKKLLLVWDVDVSQITSDETEPSIPAIVGRANVRDNRLEGTVYYITDSWRSLDELRSDKNILSQLRPGGRAVRTATNILVSRDTGPVFAFYVITGVIIAITVFGALRLRSQNKQTNNNKHNTV